MNRVLVVFLVLVAMTLGIAGVANAEHGSGIDPFSVRATKVKP